MSKIVDALNEAGEEKSNIVSPIRKRTRKSWFAWVLAFTVIAMFVMFSYYGSDGAVPLSEIFPDEEVFPIDVEYEFVRDEAVLSEAEEMVQVFPEIPAVAPVAEAIAKDFPPAEVKSIDKENAYTIQIASFKDKKLAEKALVKIRAKVPSAHIVLRDLGQKGIWHRIYAGQFERRSEAEVTLSNIKRNYSDSFIISSKRVR